MYYVRCYSKRSKTPVMETCGNLDKEWCIAFARSLSLMDQNKPVFTHVGIDEGNPYETIISFTVER